MNINQFIEYFENVKKSGNGYMARCPVHNDRKNSLSISEKGDKILINCFAGCQKEEIMESVGLKTSDLFNSHENKEILNEIKYEYCDINGNILYYKTRIEYIDNTKKFIFYQPNGQVGVKGLKRVPYNLSQLIKADTIYFVEGEKCADAVIKQGKVATTLDTGAKSKWLEEYNKYFEGKKVFIIPDNDKAGMIYANKIKNNLPQAKIIKIPDLSEKEDIFDWLNLGHKIEELESLPYYEEDKEITNKTQAELALYLAERSIVNLFNDNFKQPCAKVDKCSEILPLKSEKFKCWLKNLYFNETKKIIKKETVNEVIDMLVAKAMYDSTEEIELFTRIGYKDNIVWYDLNNKEGQSVKITEDGWNIENHTPILFKNYNHQKTQVIPKTGGDIYKIFDYINIKSDKILFLCCLISYFIPNIPHTMMMIYGEKGSAKSTAVRILKSLIDPSSVDLLGLSNNKQDLLLNCKEHWLLPFDNVSKLNVETSDMLCRVITGAGIQQRKLYTDDESYILSFQRCCIINGVNNVVNRSDLLDRSILLELERISEENRKEISCIDKNFNSDLPFVLGGIFDIIAKAMKIFPTVELDKLPRMADFTKWGYAIGQALGGHGDKFLQQYEMNRNKQNIEAINSDIVATLIVEFMNNIDCWNGLVSELYCNLTEIASNFKINTKTKEFPSKPNTLSRRLNSIKSNLESIGITFKTHCVSRGTMIYIEKEKISPLQPYFADNGDNGDKI